MSKPDAMCRQKESDKRQYTSDFRCGKRNPRSFRQSIAMNQKSLEGGLTGF